MVPTVVPESCEAPKRKFHNMMSPASAWCDGQEHLERVLLVFAGCNFLDL